jgi:hypothetical protein
MHPPYAFQILPSALKVISFEQSSSGMQEASGVRPTFSSEPPAVEFEDGLTLLFPPARSGQPREERRMSKQKRRASRGRRKPFHASQFGPSSSETRGLVSRLFFFLSLALQG